MDVAENVGQVLVDLQTRVAPAFSAQTGMSWNFTSAVGNGSFSETGFLITKITLAKVFGVQVGDRIVSLNERPVNSPVQAWWTYQVLFIKNRQLTEIRVGIVRQGMQLTKTFRIR